MSALADLMSGIGPLLFLILISDLMSHLKKFGVTLKLFADDAKVYVEIVDIYNTDQLQGALVSLAERAETWQLPIALSKCCIGNAALCRPMCIDGNTLPVVNTCRDLSVLISSDLSPSVHIDGIVARLNSVPMQY